MRVPAFAQDATPQAAAPAAGAPQPDGQVGDTNVSDQASDIVVTGYRESLDSAVGLKRNSVSAVDAIVAQDIAAFPDQNLAESLQRIPGIAITRDGGEGREVTVRGLGAGYTQVRLNGMETIATSEGNDGVNNTRSFDFDLFASDLFNSLVVHKTPEAQLDEGTLGATVDLNTGDPMSYKDGLTFVGSAKAQYSGLNNNVGPRLAGLIAYKDPGGAWAASLSAAWSQYDTAEFGADTARWAQGRFNSVNGTPCFTAAGSGGAYVPSADCDAAALAFHPRIPRYDDIYHTRTRLGITGSIELHPSEHTQIDLNGLYAKYNETRDGRVAEVLFRSNERGIDVVDYQIDPKTNQMISGDFDNAWVRVEHSYRETFNNFHQFSGDIKQDFSDTFSATLFGGFSESKTYTPDDVDLIFDDRNANGFSFDYSGNQNRPRITFNDDITHPEAFQFAEFRDARTTVTNKFRTAKLDLTWKAADGFTATGGAFYRRYNFNTHNETRNSTYCAAFACTGDQYGATVSDAISTIYQVPDLGDAPAGTNASYVLPDIGAASDSIGLGDRPFNPDTGNIRGVQEEDTGGYLQFNVDSSIFGLHYAANAGVRFAHTALASTGINSAQTITVNRGYDDWLPALNIALYPTSNIVVRGAIAKVMTRPDLGNLTPGGSVDGFNYVVKFGNPQLDPTRATSYDLGVEWYFHRGAVLSAAVFKKDIASFPIASSREGTYASTGLPVSLIIANAPAARDPEAQPWTINTILNGPGASLKGFEIGLQTPFYFLPGFLQNFGVTANLTYVDSAVQYTLPGPATDPDTLTFPQLVPVTRTETLIGLSPWSYNFTLYYENKDFSVRGSLAYRDAYIDSISANGNVFDGYDSTLNVDASATYNVTKNVTLTLEGINLTDTDSNRFTDIDAQRMYFSSHTGRVFLAGARFKF